MGEGTAMRRTGGTKFGCPPPKKKSLVQKIQCIILIIQALLIILTLNTATQLPHMSRCNYVWLQRVQWFRRHLSDPAGQKDVVMSTYPPANVVTGGCNKGRYKHQNFYLE